MKNKSMSVEQFASALADALMTNAGYDRNSSDTAHNNNNAQLANDYAVAYRVKKDIAALIRQVADVE